MEKDNKVSITYNDIEKSVVDAIMVVRQVRYYDVRLVLKGTKYIVPVVLDSSNKEDNFDFRSLPYVSDENCEYLLEKIENAIDKIPSLKDCKHVKDNPDYQKDFYRDCIQKDEANEFFDNAIKEYHEFCENHPISFLNNALNATDELDKNKDYQSYLESRKEPYELNLWEWDFIKKIIDSLPLSSRIFYKSFYDDAKHSHAEWAQCFDRLITELKEK